MILGQTITAENSYDDSGTPTITKKTTTVYTPWFPRGGDKGVFAAEIIDISQKSNDGTNVSLPTITMTVETKNHDQADSTAASQTKGSDSVDGDVTSVPTTLDVTSSSGLLELVRLRFELSDEEPGTPILRTFYVILRVLNPSWPHN